MILYIDNREPDTIIEQLNFLNNSLNITITKKNLDIGDYLIYDEINQKPVILIERKSYNDLLSSIKDGRYNEQSYRLNNYELNNHNIFYLIEGNINAQLKQSQKILYSAIFSLNYYKGFSIYYSNNLSDTAIIIFNIISKLIKEKNKIPYFSNSNNIFNENTNENANENTNIITNDYVQNIKNTKKSNINKENILQIMLNQIPGISNVNSSKIISKYNNNLYYLLEQLKFEDISNNNDNDIPKNIKEKLKYYLI
mgnify:FL=1|tara:strand:+ start:298 stop:1059 length:762 start_codon:yes stop_codon:yes gene_type:complete